MPLFFSLPICDVREQPRTFAPVSYRTKNPKDGLLLGRTRDCATISEHCQPHPAAVHNCKHVPGNSVSDMGERMKGGAVKVERSPVNVVILEIAMSGGADGLGTGAYDLRKSVQLERWLAGTES